MDEELNLDLGNEDITRKDNRIKSLSDKVKTTSEERDAEKVRADKAEAERVTAQKDADFFKNFNTVSPRYQGASEYQDKIREKAALGLDVEEATMLVMAKEGKYTPPVAPLVRESAAGGSAATGIHDSAEKTADKMTQAERRAILQEMESKGEFKL